MHTGGHKASRMEKGVRNQSRLLLGFSIVLLVVCVAMTSRYGWGLGAEAADKWLYAVGNGSVDAGGALMVSLCGSYFALRQRGAFGLALIASSVCFCVSLSAIVGFQSSGRETQVQ